ncbi:hypothetical protein [Clostridium taeniosporum]|uniref:Uncharacterized protein n=1 Tax=Clostridium taeniosporum TaxID=394958 RepID=A0A1D7XMG4_9CLOT|nr:hypothetical protein [Clostridium taeniosporum]AOR24563.1 hypothetical protein BGI42_12805 [Clostridium taeniosporum]
MKKRFLFLKNILNKICLGDRCLIIIMGILFFHITFQIFTSEIKINSTEIINAIDVVVRTTIASVFGYFISSNFVRNKRHSKNKHNDYLKYNNSEEFCLNNKEELSLKDNKNLSIDNFNEQLKEEKRPNYERRAQIIIVFVIGLISLILLLIIRDFIKISDSEIPIISQLRDIVSGCVGFLIGCPSNVK